MSEAGTAVREGRIVGFGAVAFLILAVVLLALGTAFAGNDPIVLDLWVLAIGLFLLAGSLTLIGIGRRGPAPAPTPPAHSYSGPASLAEVPALADRDADFAIRRTAPSPRSWTSSDTIAGQYAEAARLRSGRAVQRRLSNPEEGDAPAARSPFWSSMRRDSAASGYDSDRGPATRSALEGEVDRLRTRVAELESERTPRSGPPVFPPDSNPDRPTLCAGCGAVLIGSPSDAKCPSCGRPLCGLCYATVPEGPVAHQCPDCRTAKPPPPPPPPAGTTAAPMPLPPPPPPPAGW